MAVFSFAMYAPDLAFRCEGNIFRSLFYSETDGVAILSLFHNFHWTHKEEESIEDFRSDLGVSHVPGLSISIRDIEKRIRTRLFS